MSLLTTSSSSTTWSYQLQFNFKFRKSQTPLLFIKAFRGSNPGNIRRHHLRVHCVAQDEAKSSSSSDESERRRSGDSWNNLKPSAVDAALSDWFGNSDSSSDSGKKNGIGGILGVGLAGVLLVAGITSAAIAIGKRSSSRSMPVMKPITEQQEVLLSSEEEVIGEEGNINDGKLNVHDESNPQNGSQTVLVNDDTNEDSSYVNENSTPIGLDASPLEQVQTDSASPDVNSPDTIPISPDFSQPENVEDSYVASSFIDTMSTIVMNETDDQLDAVPNSAEAGQIDASDTGLEPSSSVVLPINLQNVDSSATIAATETDSVPIVDKPVVTSVASKEEDEVQKPSVFVSRGIPAPTLLSAALQVPPGKVLVPAVADQTQSQALMALQVLKVIESDAQPGDLCTRREYARWLVSASSTLSRNLILKVYPAMYIENATELAFDDITPEDPDFSFIQGLAEAGLISSKLSRRDMMSSPDEDIGSFYFHPNSPLSRQDLVTWKMALEKRQLPEADRKALHQLSGFIDIDRIDPDACPALVADLSAAEPGIVALAFGYTRLFQPDKPVTKGQAAIALATGEAVDAVSEEIARIEAESIAEKAVATHNALMAEVEKDINANFEMELLMEREKIDAVQKMAEEAMQEVEKLRAEREEKNIVLMKERATVESEMEVLSKLRHELEEQWQSVMSNKAEISYEKEQMEKLKKETEDENRAITRLQYELEVERKALSMARAWAEDEAKRVQGHAKALEEARDRWERKGLKVMVDDDLRGEEEASADVTWTNVGKKLSVEETTERAETLMDKLKVMASEVSGKFKEIINQIIQKIQSLITAIKEWFSSAGKQTTEFRDVAVAKVGGSVQELQQNATGFGTTVKEGVEKLTQKFKT
ncbi:hypothetical protein SOVF_007250 isoform A [Spinacia oleracea]|uniref:Uncharacterized protein isoform X1 n=2 Tax=Spinacia oleracea TaxID=3562 RepID=A0A9R0I7J8_SPIOL|nr:uncharacterized protein LOC110784164 isoform X1 [Spinacia oleracea]KNA25357.1 hypothetical protein SOVF_007250 isoform A [Spinacia oleracea]